jgi:thymidylate synthase
MNAYNFGNTSMALVNMLKLILAKGAKVTVRGQETLELTNVTLQIDKPWERCLIMPERHDNIFAKIAETLWVLGGRNDIEWLSYYLPRAGEWSDDGEHWRAGYGQRLRHWNTRLDWDAAYETDQVEKCLELLKNDPTTRRAVMSLWSPGEDYCDSLDIPCNNWLHWYIRNGELCLNIAQRSSDIIWGFSGINMFEWSVLQQVMARDLRKSGILVYAGPITYFISSLHLYEKHYSRAEKIIKGFVSDAYCTEDMYPLKMCTDWVLLPEFDAEVLKIFDMEYGWRNGAAFEYSHENGLLMAMASMLYVFIDDNIMAQTTATEDERAANVARMIDEMLMPETDFRLSAIEYYRRRYPKLLDYLILQPRERAVLERVGIL